MTQDEKFTVRLKQVLSEAGLHEIVVYVTPEKTIGFWVVKQDKTEGEQKEKPVQNVVE